MIVLVLVHSFLIDTCRLHSIIPLLIIAITNNNNIMFRNAFILLILRNLYVEVCVVLLQAVRFNSFSFHSLSLSLSLSLSFSSTCWLDQSISESTPKAKASNAPNATASKPTPSSANTWEKCTHPGCGLRSKTCSK